MGTLRKTDRAVEYTTAGVVTIDSSGIDCNDNNIMSKVSEAVWSLRPDSDASCAFAARVTVSVELLGDLEGEA